MSVTGTTKLDQLQENLSKAKSVGDVNGLLVDVERQVMKRVYDDRNAGRDTEAYTAEDYLLGEKNTRGLSWKLVLMREVARANFCQMIRIGAHGGTVKIVGQPSNIAATRTIYEALASSFDPIGQAAFASYNDARGENDAPVHKIGWVNQFLINTPTELGAALTESREKDAGGNAKLAKMLEEKNSDLQAYLKSLAPSKPTPAPKDSNAAPKKKGGQKKSDAEIIAAAAAAQNGTEAGTTEAASSTEGGTATDTGAEATA